MTETKQWEKGTGKKLSQKGEKKFYARISTYH